MIKSIQSIDFDYLALFCQILSCTCWRASNLVQAYSCIDSINIEYETEAGAKIAADVDGWFLPRDFGSNSLLSVFSRSGIVKTVKHR